MIIITRADLQAKLSEAFKDKWYQRADHLSGPFLGLMDSHFVQPAAGILNELKPLKPLKPNWEPFAQDEVYDCEEFAMQYKCNAALYGLHFTQNSYPFAIGVVWGEFTWVPEGYHAANCAYLANGTLVFIEPQTMNVYDADKCTGAEVVLF